MNKTWLHILIGALLGLLFSAIILLVAQPSRGDGVALAPKPTSAPILVSVTGEVVQPGVYSLAPGSRVTDAIAAAGGYLVDADPLSVNLAAHLADGEQVFVGSKGAWNNPVSPETGRSQSVEPGNELFTPQNPLNLNTATLEDLLLLPGIGPEKAKNVLDYREAHSRFSTIDEIMEVEGIGAGLYEDLKNVLFVD